MDLTIKGGIMKRELYLQDLQKWNCAKDILEKNNVEITDPTQPHWTGNGNGTRVVLTLKETKTPIFIYRKDSLQDVKNKIEKILEKKEY